MNISTRDFGFLTFFIPLFFAKLMNITASDKTLVVIAVVSFLFFFFDMINTKMSRKEVTIWILLAGYGAFLILLCGKEGVFFSIIAIIAMKKIDYKRVFKVLITIGIIAIVIYVFKARNAVMVTRFINGTWTLVSKRSNIIYVSFLAVISLICMYKRNLLKRMDICIFAILSYLMYVYSGCRTGMVSAMILVIMLIVLRHRGIRNNKIVQYLCACSPIIGFLLSYGLSYYYGKISWIYHLNNLSQGRFAQGKNFLNIYSVKLFGQKISESIKTDSYAMLDSAYLDMLLSYGLVFILLWMVVTFLTVRYLQKQDRYVECAVIVMYAVYGISETFLTNCFLNVSILLYGEYLYSVISPQLVQKMSNTVEVENVLAS